MDVFKIIVVASLIAIPALMLAGMGLITLLDRVANQRWKEKDR